MDKDVVYVYTKKYSSAIRNNQYPPFASTWTELEGITLSEISQSEKDKHYMVSFIWGIYKIVKGNKGKGVKISVGVTKHERHRTLGNEQGVVEGEVGEGLG